MKRYISTALCVLAGVLMPLITHAQIKGVVTDSLTHEPLMYITVQYEGKGVGGITNGNG